MKKKWAAFRESPDSGCASHRGTSVRLVILVPAYNPGSQLGKTIAGLLEYHPDIWVLVDGSSDGSERGLNALARNWPGFRIFCREQNLGKGATILRGVQQASVEGFTHVLCFDADGQHPPEFVPRLKKASQRHPEALIMGEPRFGRDAPWERVYFRKLANWCAFLETGGGMPWDCMFGMRVYPVQALLKAFSKTKRGRGYDFDTEIAVRMVWDGVKVYGIQVPVRYLSRAEGGISHFCYWRDNRVLFGMHGRLLCEAFLRFAMKGLGANGLSLPNQDGEAFGCVKKM